MRLIPVDRLAMIEKCDAERRAIRLASEATESWARRTGDVVRFDTEFGTLIHERTDGIDGYHVARQTTGEPSEANRVHRAHDTSLYPRTASVAVSPDATDSTPSVRVNGTTVSVADFRATQRKKRRTAATEAREAREAQRERLLATQGTQSGID